MNKALCSGIFWASPLAWSRHGSGSLLTSMALIQLPSYGCFPPGSFDRFWKLPAEALWLCCSMESTASPSGFISLNSWMLSSFPLKFSVLPPSLWSGCTARELFMLWNYLLTLMHEEIIPKPPEKYSACCKKFRELTGIRETFQTGQKHGSISKDLCHPGAIVWCSKDSYRTVTLGIPAD